MITEQKQPVGVQNASLQKERRSIPWIWEGVLAEEAVTLLSAPEKTGKTTLLSLLLHRRRAGGELLGRTVYPGKTIVCSEENQRLWTLRQPPLDFGPDVVFLSAPVPFPTRGRWRRVLDDIFKLGFPSCGFDLIVIDTAINFLPLADRNKRTLRWALGTLGDLTDLPAAVLVLNQSRNIQRPLAASADIVVDMTVPRSSTPLSPYGRGVGGEGTRRRAFTCRGRYPGTLEPVSAELNTEGTDYVLVDQLHPARPALLGTLQTLLAASPTPLTCNELLDRWPDPKPRDDSLYRTLGRACQLGLFTVSGKGTKSEPFRFSVAQRAEDAGSQPQT